MKKQFILLSFMLLELSCASQEINVNNTTRKAQNLASFGRLYGYVKYFYPGDEAAKLDWTKFELYAIPKVERAGNSVELKKILDSLFIPIAPGLKIYENSKKETFDKANLLPAGKDTAKMQVISWQHFGLGLSNKGIYQDARLGRGGPVDPGMFGNFMCCLQANEFQGKTFRFKVAVKIQPQDSESSGHLWFRVDRPERKTGFFDNMNDRPIKKNEWAYYEITGKVDNDAKNVCFGMMLYGKGKMWIDDATLSVKNTGGGWEPVKTLDGDFEDADENEFPSPWFQPSAIKGYRDIVSEEYSFKGKKSILITNDNVLFAKMNHFGDFVQKDIGNNLSCILPLAVYGDNENTYPLPPKEAYYMLTGRLENEISSNYDPGDQLIMLANIIKFWNVYEHFYPYYDLVNVDWQKALIDMIKEVYTDKSKNDFTRTLKKYVGLMRDGHGFVIAPESRKDYLPGIRVELIEKQLIVSELLDKNIGVTLGDKVLSVDGIDWKQYVDSLKEYTYGATEGFRNFTALKYGFCKDSGSITCFVIKGSDGTEKTIKCKNIYNVRILNYSVNNDTYKKIAKNIYYLNLNNITTEEIEKLMPKLIRAKSIICDMRGYPKSDFKLIQHMLTHNDTCKTWMRIPQIIKPDHDFADYKNFSWRLKPLAPHINAKIIYIIDGRAVSAAESYTGFYQGYKLATLIGQPTAGTNGNINIAPLAGGYSFYFTGMKVVKLDGSTLFGVGFKPDIPIEKTITGVKEGRDEFLEKAIELAKTY